MSWLGLDIGGANLKAATSEGWALSRPFALWRHTQELSGALARLVESAPVAEQLAITMTGELCDCFSSKSEGVRHILNSVQSIAGMREVRVYFVDGQFATLDEAYAVPELAAASNWHALASFACRYITSGSGMLIDIGSTTTDLIPIVNGQVAAQGRNDRERLLSHELLYRGVGRTPICAVTDALPIGDNPCPIAAEVFATTADAYVVLGVLDEDPSADWTADGRPLSVAHAQQRIARQFCADSGDLSDSEIRVAAMAIWAIQRKQLEHSFALVAEKLPEAPKMCILAGAGEFLARSASIGFAAGSRIVSLDQEIGVAASGVAPAYAVAVLASEAGLGAKHKPDGCSQSLQNASK